MTSNKPTTDTDTILSNQTPTIAIEAIASRILVVRTKRVLLDRDLAALYGVEVRAVNQAVKRNPDRFPDDFVFQLKWQEAEFLKSQSVILDDDQEPQTSGSKRGTNLKFKPYGFTEQGVAMLSSVLRSPQAIAVNIEIMRAFVRMREVLASNTELAAKLNELEQRIDRKLQTHDDSIANILNAIRQLMTPPNSPKRPIGFIQPNQK
jgi:ORF6N domain